MKKFVLTCFTFLVAGQICFASNIRNFKTEMFGNKNNQEIFSELKDSLNESYQAETTQEIAIGNNVQEQDKGRSILLNKYPEFSGTQLESPLIETFNKNPNLEIKSISYDMEDYTKYSYSLPSIFNIVFSNGKKLSLEVIHKDYYVDLVSLWTKNPQRVAQYRTLISLHKQAKATVRSYVKQVSGTDYNEYIPFSCKHSVAKVNISGEKKIQCMPVSISNSTKKYTQMGAVRFYPIHTNSSWLYFVDNTPWINNISKTSPHAFNPYTQNPYRKAYGDASSCASTGWFVYRHFFHGLPFTEARDNWLGRNVLPSGGIFNFGLTTDKKAITYQNDPAFWDWATKLKTKEGTYGFREESNGLVWKSYYWLSDLDAQGQIFFLANNKLIPYLRVGNEVQNSELGYYCRKAIYDDDLEEVQRVSLKNFVSPELIGGARCEIIVRDLPKTFIEHLNSLK